MKDNFCYQDWETVVMTKPTHIIRDIRPQKSDRIFDRSKDDINNSLKVAIQRGRTSKKMSQKQLAILMNCQSSLIKQYENGKAIPNNNFICKLERILQTKMPRKKRINCLLND